MNACAECAGAPIRLCACRGAAIGGNGDLFRRRDTACRCCDADDQRVRRDAVGWGGGGWASRHVCNSPSRRAKLRRMNGGPGE
eukprot:5856239-Prymnesium_polylepis.2